MAVSDKLLAMARKIRIHDLPISVYVVSPDGRIVEANKLARELLKLPEGELKNLSILSYYRDPSLRDELPKILERLESEEKHLSIILNFDVNGHEMHIQEHARSLKDPETGEVLGFLCCMGDVTEEVNYRQMFDALPVGVYLLDKDDKIVQVNETLVKLLGYDSSDDMEGRHVQELYVDPEDAVEFRESFENKDSIVDHVAHVLKKDGVETTFVSVSAKKITSPQEGYKGRRGTIMDASNERYRRILEVAPIGLYEARRINGEDRIVHCNQHFADINEFDSREQAQNYELSKLHASPEGYKRFLRDVEENSRADRPPLNHELQIITVKKNEKVFEVSGSALFDRGKNIIGHIGAVKDVSEEEKFKNKVAELTQDIGNVLHTYSSALVNLQQSADGVIESLDPDPFPKITDLQITGVLAVFADPAKQTAKALKRLLAIANNEERLKALPAERWEALSATATLLEDYEQIVPYPEFRPSTLREAALTLMKALGEIKGGKLPKELIKNIRWQAQELLRLLNLYSLHKISFLTSELGPQIRAVRDYVISDVRLK